MTVERKDAVWLQSEVTRLFEAAARAVEPDHDVCAQYATLLYKMLPRDTGKPKISDSMAEEIRKAIREETT